MDTTKMTYDTAIEDMRNYKIHQFGEYIDDVAENTTSDTFRKVAQFTVEKLCIKFQEQEKRIEFLQGKIDELIKHNQSVQEILLRKN